MLQQRISRLRVLTGIIVFITIIHCFFQSRKSDKKSQILTNNFRSIGQTRAEIFDLTILPTNQDIPKLSLVESIPLGDFPLKSNVLSTADTLLHYTQHAQSSIDINAMYWNLLGSVDRQTFSKDQMHAFGADRGQKLFQALVSAAKRGVHLRILTSKEENEMPMELKNLLFLVGPEKTKFVSIRYWEATQWYGGGILHQKLWIFDQSHIYLGSANMDWKSLAQVMEVGILLSNLPSSSNIMRDFIRLFDTWWIWSSLPPSTSIYFSSRFHSKLKVPSWSTYLQNQTADPFGAKYHSLGNISHPILLNAAENIFVSAAPMEATVELSRAFDEDSLVYTITSAKSFIYLNVMDYAPYSHYTLERIGAQPQTPLSWPALNDALVAAMYTGVHVKLLISKWQHSSSMMFSALRILQNEANLCYQIVQKRNQSIACPGSLEIRLFQVPGWNETTSTTVKVSKWPSFSRVNHGKFIVTDNRVNIGTSNMEWSYFYTTAGISVNTNHKAIRYAVEHLFLRNWNSTCATSLNDASDPIHA